MKCKYCGAEVGREYRICPYCDSEIEYPVDKSQQPIIIQNIINNNVQPTSTPNNYYGSLNTNNMCSSKNKCITLLLCIFFGYIGVHHFYAGKIGMGLVYLFTGGLLYVGWIYDIIKIASGTFKDGLGLPITK